MIKRGLYPLQHYRKLDDIVEKCVKCGVQILLSVQAFDDRVKQVVNITHFLSNYYKLLYACLVIL